MHKYLYLGLGILVICLGGFFGVKTYLAWINGMKSEIVRLRDVESTQKVVIATKEGTITALTEDKEKLRQDLDNLSYVHKQTLDKFDKQGKLYDDAIQQLAKVSAESKTWLSIPIPDDVQCILTGRVCKSEGNN